MDSTPSIAAQFVQTPIGIVCIESNGAGIIRTRFTEEQGPDLPDTHTKAASEILLRYLDKKPIGISFPLFPKGSVFSVQVWSAVQQIPFGETRTYLQLALSLGGNNYARAVGSAIASNPILLFIPCHRVLGSAQELTGYAGGIERKEWLLQHEGVLPGRQAKLF